jgi:hypothetical protein
MAHMLPLTSVSFLRARRVHQAWVERQTGRQVQGLYRAILARSDRAGDI